MANQLSFWLATFTVHLLKYKVTFSVHGQPNLNSYFVLCLIVTRVDCMVYTILMYFMIG